MPCSQLNRMTPGKLEATLDIKRPESVLQPITSRLLYDKGVRVFIKRDDRLHPVISGNKWRKLKYPLLDIMQRGVTEVVSMGGQWSNHLHALAYAGNQLNIKTHAFVRGEANDSMTPTLKDIRSWGMQLDFIPRQEYRALRQSPEKFTGAGSNRYWLPEGGAMDSALIGVGEIIEEIDIEYDVLTTACGTGATLTGMARAASKDTMLIGFAALRSESFLQNGIARWLGEFDPQSIRLQFDYHFGGMANSTPALEKFIHEFQLEHGIPVEPVYTGKMLYGLFDLIRQDYFQPGCRIVALHSGGLQGNRRRP